MKQKKYMITSEAKGHMQKQKENIFDYIKSEPDRNGKPAWKRTYGLQ